MIPTTTHRRSHPRSQDGFTLIELLVVIIILGILSAVVVFAVRGAGDKGQSAAVATDERTIRTAEEAYCASEGKYATMDELVAGRYLSDASDIHDVVPVNPDEPGRQGNCGSVLATKHYKITCLLTDCGVEIPDPDDPVETCDPLDQPALSGPGVLDTTFGTKDLAGVRNGKQTTDFDGTGTKDDRANAVAIDSDDKIVVAGSSGGGAFPVVRYYACGDLDPTFDSDGKRTTQFPAPPGASITTASASEVAIDSSRRIVVAGSATVVNNDGTQHGDFAVARYTATGALDETFSGDGMVTTNFDAASGDFAMGMAIDSNGRVVVVGSSNGKFALARYTPGGALDITFDGDGKVTTDMGAYDVDGFPLPSFASAVAIDPSDRIVVAGRASSPGLVVAPDDFAFARYKVDGTLDNLFGVGGKVYFDAGYQDGASSLALQPDGKIIAGGSVTPAGYIAQKMAVVRLHPDGTRDATFGVAEGELGPMPGGGLFSSGLDSPDATAYGVALQGDGKIIVVGSFHNQTTSGLDFAIVRLDAQGAFDTGFGSAVPPPAKVSTDFGGQDRGLAVAIHRTGIKAGRIVVVGGGKSGTANGDFALARYVPS